MYQIGKRMIMHSKDDEILNSFHVRNEETYFVYVFRVENKWIGENMYEWHGEGMTIFQCKNSGVSNETSTWKLQT